MNPVPALRLAPGREKSAREGHPWIFSGALAPPGDAPAAGSVVRVDAADGSFVGWGHFSPASQIRVRVLSRREEVFPDEAWLRARLREAVARRRDLLGEPDGACRLVFSEADLLPGLIVDRYGPWLAVQILSAGMEASRAAVLDELGRILEPRGVVERSDDANRALEGLAPAAGLLAGAMPPPGFTILEAGLRFPVDLAHGQKTGFYVDQRLNRPAVAAWARGRRVLDAFCYTGGFAAHAATAGAAELVLLDSSREALGTAAGVLAANGHGGVPQEIICGNAFEELRRLRDRGRAFDLVVLDPPRLAPTRAHAQRASRAYKDANLLAMKLLAPEGILATFSCSGGVDAGFFREIVRWAAKDAGREVQVLATPGQPPDHPVRLAFPEGEYLKGLLLRIL